MLIEAEVDNVVYPIGRQNIKPLHNRSNNTSPLESRGEHSTMRGLCCSVHTQVGMGRGLIRHSHSPFG